MMSISARAASGLRPHSRRPRSQIVAGVAWLLTVALVLVSFVLRLGNNAASLSTVSGPELLIELLFWEILLQLGPIAYATLGVLIGTRRPHYAAGWLNLTLTLDYATQA